MIANADDYALAKRLFEHSYETGPDRAVEELLAAAEGLMTFRVEDLLEKLGWRHSKTYSVLARAKELGCVGDGEDRGRYEFLRRSTVPPLNLPDTV